MTEPDAGSDLRGIRTRATRGEGGDWILNGSKTMSGSAGGPGGAPGATAWSSAACCRPARRCGRPAHSGKSASSRDARRPSPRHQPGAGSPQPPHLRPAPADRPADPARTTSPPHCPHSDSESIPSPVRPSRCSRPRCAYSTMPTHPSEPSSNKTSATPSADCRPDSPRSAPCNPANPRPPDAEPPRQRLASETRQRGSVSTQSDNITQPAHGVAEQFRERSDLVGPGARHGPRNLAWPGATCRPLVANGALGRYQKAAAVDCVIAAVGAPSATSCGIGRRRGAYSART
jgi:Acyl-CoA dehydrogenase, middle domain